MLKKQLIADEGMRLRVYVDSLGYLTFGVGHLVTKQDPEFKFFQQRKPDQIIPVSLGRVEDVLKADIEICLRDCRKLFPGFDKFLEEIQQIVANMMFNLGLPRLSKFKNFIKAVCDQNYRRAEIEMKNSAWFEQVGDRAKRLVLRMEKLANDSLCNVSSN